MHHQASTIEGIPMSQFVLILFFVCTLTYFYPKTVIGLFFFRLMLSVFCDV